MDINGLVPTGKERQQIEEDLNTLDVLSAEIQFDELIDYAASVCLDHPLPPLEKTNLTDMQRLVNNMGVVSLRSALELEMGIELYREDEVCDEDAEVAEGKGLTYLRQDTPMRNPGMFYEVGNHQIVKKVEQFGKAMVDESFKVLGQDAYKYVELMKSSDVEQQKVALNWLYKRIDKLHSPALENEPDALLYHPIRLSPKAIGTYPNTRLELTCLGSSILSASFFEKAEIPYLHAGVMETYEQSQLKYGAFTLSIVGEKLRDTGDRSIFADKVEQLRMMIARRLNKDRGYHAATYLKLADDTWQEFDPFYHINDTVHPGIASRIERVNDTLNEFRESAPSLELPVDAGLSIFEVGLAYGMLNDDVNRLGGDEVAVLHSLMDTEEESVTQKIYEELIKPYFEHLQTDETVSEEFRTSLGYIFEDRGNAKFRPLEDAFYKVFHKYVLWEKSSTEVIARAKSDAEFRQRLMNDIKNIPIMMVGALATESVEHGIIDVRFISQAELGLPHARIGFSVLSDFAAYSDVSPAPSVWFANWASLVPITETMDTVSNKYQARLVGNMAVWSEHRGLTYTKSRDIVGKFIDGLVLSNETKENGSEQEDSESGSRSGDG